MNLTMTITLDGLIRALRWKEHDLAERIERGYARPDVPSMPRRPVPRGSDLARRDDDDRGGR
jgi:hypothetical protein